MEFKNWLCIEEVFSLFRQICESRSVFEDIPIEGIKNEFNNLCGFQYEWHKYLLVLLNRKMPNALKIIARETPVYQLWEGRSWKSARDIDLMVMMWVPGEGGNS